MIAFNDDPTRLASQPVASESGAARLSLPEIGSLCLRAGRGADLPWGLAEEAASAAQWLARNDFGWAEAVISRFTGGKGADFTPAPGIWAGEGPVCGLRAGVALADFAALPEGPGAGAVSLGTVLDPLLVVPFAARAAASCGVALRIEADGLPIVWVSPEGGVRKYSLPLPGASAELRVILDSGLPETEPRQLDESPGGNIATALWVRLEELALGMTVPATAQSLAGAGAEGDDND